MEGTNQEKRASISNSISYTHPPKITQESTLKLPQAPIISTDRIANATVSARRRSSIFSPTQTVDQPYSSIINNIPPPNNLDLTSDSDPTHTNTISTSEGGVNNTSDSRTPPQIPQTQNIQPSPPPKELAESTPSVLTNKTTTRSIVRYKECLKNHAANMGGHVLDGCGEFMPGGEEDTLEYLRCAACDCHRNFHRKEVECESPQLQRASQYNAYNIPNYSGNHVDDNSRQRKVSTVIHQHPHNKESSRVLITPPTMMNFGGGNSRNVATESSSEGLNMFEGDMRFQSSDSKKRYRTKFSQEQKDKMHEFATKLGWRIQRQDDQEVLRFCNEVGVKRQVFKVWMHNNKQAMKRRSSSEV